MKINFFWDKIKSNKLFFKNFSYLTLVEVINLVLPFITLPYLLITLNKENYGLVIFSQSIVLYFLIIQNFGLNTYAVKEISTYLNNKNKLNSIVSTVIIIKIGLFLFNFFLLYGLTFFIPVIGNNKILFYLSMWVCLFDVIFPRWYFQGIEKMKWITYVFFVSKTLSLILIFALIKIPSDSIKVPLIYGVGGLISSIAGLYVVFKIDKIKFAFQSINSIKQTIKSSITFFISDVSVAIFANSNKVIIGATLGMVDLSYYDIAEKVISASRNIPLNIVRDSIYPRVVKTKNLLIVKKTTIFMSFYAIFVIVIIFFAAPFIINTLGGGAMQKSITILRIFSITIFTTHFSNYYITVGLWSMGYEKSFRNLMMYSALFFFILISILWIFQSMNVYTLTSLPIFVDLYLIVHTYLLYKQKKILNE